MGFGHRVYKNYDPRAKLMRETCNEVLAELGLQNDPLFKLAMALEKMALEDEYFVSRKLYPNVDFYSGIVQRAIGIPVSLFTAIFALARTVGWIAQLNEMIGDPEYKIGRPRQLFVLADRRHQARRQAHRATLSKGSDRSFARRIDLTSLQLFVAVCEPARSGAPPNASHRGVGGQQAPVGPGGRAVDAAAVSAHARRRPHAGRREPACTTRARCCSAWRRCRAS
jgi:hypothetical protein